ncbi:MAG: HDOD domain-containing protein [Steroidobacteraceae bacterium]
MVSLFFWRRKRPTVSDIVAAAAAPAPASAASTAPAAPAAPAATLLPLQRLVHALGLRDARAADLHARLDAGQNQLLLAASSEFARVGTEPRYTPQRPALFTQLLEVVNDEEASLRALSRIISQDPQLTGSLLRTANGPLYRVSTAPVESVERAAALLGTTGMRTLIASSMIKPAVGGRSSGRFGDIAWEHALYSASAAEAWAARNQDADPFAAHLLALLYGLGSLAVYRVLLDLYARQPALPADAAAIATSLETNATVTAARIAESWGLSERTREALHAQSAPATAGETALARALRFGLAAGAVALLARHQRITEQEAVAQLAARGYAGAQTERIWERLVRAYVRPQ